MPKETLPPDGHTVGLAAVRADAPIGYNLMVTQALLVLAIDRLDDGADDEAYTALWRSAGEGSAGEAWSPGHTEMVRWRRERRGEQ